jgi:hypothetical protein
MSARGKGRIKELKAGLRNKTPLQLKLGLKEKTGDRWLTLRLRKKYRRDMHRFP